MANFPTGPDEVTAAWLSQILGTRVDGVRCKPIGTGQVGDSYRFHCEGEGGPATFAGKFPAADEASRGTAAMLGLYRKEVEFYRQAADRLDCRMPRTLFADVDESGAQFLLLFEDLGPARQGDQVSGCELSDARSAIVQAAALHASSWGKEDMLTAEWVQSAPGLSAQIEAMYPQAQAVFRERYADKLDAEHMTVCDELAGLAPVYFGRSPQPECLVHGDFRLDNMLFDVRGGEEPIAILDWQTVTAGKAMTDIGYFLGTGLGALGLDHAEDLLALYLEEMTDRGIALSREAIDHDFRLGILHGISTAVFSAAFVERTTRGDANFLSMARGGCALALRYDSIGALKEEASV